MQTLEKKPANDERPCCNCGRTIRACNGFVKVGDLVELVDGEWRFRTGLTFKNVRELCGHCAERCHWTKEGLVCRP